MEVVVYWINRYSKKRIGDLKVFTKFVNMLEIIIILSIILDK